MRSRGLSQQRARTTLVIDGVPVGQWSTADDAETSWENTKHRPGSMGRQEIVKALGTFGDRQFTRVINLDDVPLYKRLRAEQVAPDVSATETFIGPDGREESVTSIGAMGAISISGSDYNSADTRTVSITMHVEDVR